MQKIGIVGIHGRMGSELSALIREGDSYSIGPSFSRSSESPNIDEVFSKNDIIVDFSSSSMVEKLLDCSFRHSKPLILCSTGWSASQFSQDIEKASSVAPIVIASNTSIGAYLTERMSIMLAEFLDNAFDIDITEKHHNNKVDSPSGTAASIANGLVNAKAKKSEKYNIFYNTDGLRKKNSIYIHSIRAGGIYGEHEVEFTSKDEVISVKHKAMNRRMFANGAVFIIDFIVKNYILERKIQNGVYYFHDIMGYYSNV